MNTEIAPADGEDTNAVMSSRFSFASLISTTCIVMVILAQGRPKIRSGSECTMHKFTSVSQNYVRVRQ